MLNISQKNELKELQLLNSKRDLTESEMERRLVLIGSLNEDHFCETVLDELDSNQELTYQIMNFLNETGTNIEQIIFAGVAMGLYLLDRLYPSGKYGDDRFMSFWVDPCEYNEKLTSIVDNAINQALDKMIADAN